MEKQTIILRSGQSHHAVDKIGKIFRNCCESLRVFQRGGELVRVICLAKSHKDKYLKRPKGTLELESLDPVALKGFFSRIARWKKTGTDGGRVDCPQSIARDYIAHKNWPVPVLDGITSAPILRRDGTVLQQHGYDPDTQLLLVRDHGWPSVPEHPDRSDAKKALRELREPFEQFPFVSDADRAVHIACILTGIQRRLLSACPIFGYSAPTQRSGKSLLAESVAILATGNVEAASALSGDREEIRKMILATLRRGHSIVNLDNVPDGRPLASPELAMVITGSSYSDRVLGQSRNLEFPTNVLWTATGNNLAFRGDLSSRALLCQIDAKLEHPETRTFKIHRLKNHLKRQRKELVIAALTILRAFHEAGRPQQSIEPWGGFEEWSRTIREPLVWLGMADPCETRQDIQAIDPEREERLIVFKALRKKYGDREFGVAELVKDCETRRGLQEAMPQSTYDQKGLNNKSLGKWLSKNNKVIAENLRLENIGTQHGAARWRIIHPRTD